MENIKVASHLSDLPQIAEWLMDNIDHKVIAVEGPMGVGKTTFIKALCAHLQIEDRVSSPTFSLVNEYYSPLMGPVYHFDFYRLEQETEALDMGVEEYLSSDYLCLIEWPEKICNFLPGEYTSLKIREEDGKRIFEIKSVDE